MEHAQTWRTGADLPLLANHLYTPCFECSTLRFVMTHFLSAVNKWMWRTLDTSKCVTCPFTLSAAEALQEAITVVWPQETGPRELRGWCCSGCSGSSGWMPAQHSHRCYEEGTKFLCLLETGKLHIYSSPSKQGTPNIQIDYLDHRPRLIEVKWNLIISH